MLGKDLNLEEHEMKIAAKLITSFSSASASTTVRFDVSIQCELNSLFALKCLGNHKYLDFKV